MNLKQSSHEPIIINDIFSYLCPSEEIYRKWIVFKHYIDENIDEPLKAIKVIDFLFCSWINSHHSSWLLAYFPAIAFKLPLNVTRIWRASYFLTTLFPFSDTLQVFTNERTSWIWCVRWGRQFLRPFQRPDLKCDAYITNCMHAQLHLFGNFMP